MCSVSWLTTSDGYQVFFNRDEQISRAHALAPTQLTIDDVEVMMPIDPVGSGSWISMNEHGLSLCILNNYQGQTPSGPLISRGLLLKQLSVLKTVSDVATAFKKTELSHFAPFTLLAFDPALNENNLDVMAFAWNGREDTIFPTDSPLFSSGVDPKGVQQYRQHVYQKLTEKDKSISSLIKFHTHHHPELAYMSTCMSREKAKTVSFTYLTVSNDNKSMSYLPGSPCQSLSEETLEKNAYCLTSTKSFVS
ncbi:NRDE family protein [Vibrio sp. S4M6]|uniref:NRDE family protein n=1 Tax=Vibrio sinus TaxID=2946865 RepID=UPI00202A1EAD|nr:NRDE family protein [Vibrio sinus]MCL9783308.1 NRDE family protein [Vibrio sinus]